MSDLKPTPLLAKHLGYVARAKSRGVAFSRYTCPSCGEYIESRQSLEDEPWDSLAACPYCGELHMKFTEGKSIRGVKLP